MDIPKDILRTIIDSSNFIDALKQSIEKIGASNEIGETRDEIAQVNDESVSGNNMQRMSNMQQKLDSIHGKFMDMLSEAKELDPPPVELVSKLIDQMIAIKKRDAKELSQQVFDRYYLLLRQFKIELDEYKRVTSEDSIGNLFPQENVTIILPRLDKEFFIDGKLERNVKNMGVESGLEAAIRGIERSCDEKNKLRCFDH
jgi:hypothetical protein